MKGFAQAELSAPAEAKAKVFTCKDFKNSLFKIKTNANSEEYWFVKETEVLQKDMINKSEAESTLYWLDSCEFVLIYNKISGFPSLNLKDKYIYTIDKIDRNSYFLKTSYKGLEVIQELEWIEER